MASQTRVVVAALVALVSGTAIGVASAKDPPLAIPLWLAAKNGSIDVRGRSTGGYHEAALTLRNASGLEDVTVDVNGSYLRPTAARTQPLGFGIMRHGDPKTEIVLPKDGRPVDVEILSVCMQASAPSPCESTTMRLAEEPAPFGIARILRFWKEHPKLPQAEVQSAVWGVEPVGGSAVHKTLPYAFIIEELPRDAKRVVVVDGVVFALRPNGELLEAQPFERFHRIAFSCDDVVAGADGATIYALCQCSPRVPASETHERHRTIARYDVHGAGNDEQGESLGGCFTDEMDAKEARALAWASGRAAIVNEHGSLFLRNRNGEKTRVGDGGDIVVRTKRGALVLGEGWNERSARIRDVRCDSSGDFSVDTLKVPAMLTSIATGPLGVYALSTRGALVTVDALGKAEPTALFADREDQSFCTGTGRECRSILGLGDDGVLIDTDAGLHIHHGPGLLESIPRPGFDARYELDRASGMLYAWGEGDLRRWVGARREWVVVRVDPPGQTTPQLDAAITRLHRLAESVRR